MCLLGVSMMNNHIYGFKVPQNPHFGGLNRHFKPNMQIIFRYVYQIYMKFDRQLRPATESSWVVSYGGKTIPRWRTAAILKIVISPYLSEKSFDFDDILYTAADFELDERHMIKNEKVALDRLRVRRNIFLVIKIYLMVLDVTSHFGFLKFGLVYRCRRNMWFSLCFLFVVWFRKELNSFWSRCSIPETKNCKRFAVTSWTVGWNFLAWNFYRSQKNSAVGHGTDVVLWMCCRQ